MSIAGSTVRTSSAFFQLEESTATRDEVEGFRSLVGDTTWTKRSVGYREGCVSLDGCYRGEASTAGWRQLGIWVFWKQTSFSPSSGTAVSMANICEQEVGRRGNTAKNEIKSRKTGRLQMKWKDANAGFSVSSSLVSPCLTLGGSRSHLPGALQGRIWKQEELKTA